MTTRISGYARLITCLWVGAIWQPAAADILEMRDGTIIEGRFLGGSRNNLRFQIGGDIKLYPLTGILTMTLDEVRPEPAPVVRKPRDDKPRRTVIIAAGTPLAIRTREALDAETKKDGMGFRASLTTALKVRDTLVAPEETEVWGRVIRLRGQADTRELPALELTGLRINGRMYPIKTEAREIPIPGAPSPEKSAVAEGTELEFVLQVPFGVQIPVK